MSYLVSCTFDLKNATSEDYSNAYAGLEAIGLRKVVVCSGGNMVAIPTTAAMGEFNGAGVASVRDDVRSRVERVLAIGHGDPARLEGATCRQHMVDRKLSLPPA